MRKITYFTIYGVEAVAYAALGFFIAGLAGAAIATAIYTAACFYMVQRRPYLVRD